MACFQPRFRHPHYLKRAFSVSLGHCASRSAISPVKPPLSLMQKQGNGSSCVGALGRGGFGFDVESGSGGGGISAPPAPPACQTPRNSNSKLWLRESLSEQALERWRWKSADSGLAVVHFLYPVQYSIPAAAAPSGQSQASHVLLFDFGRAAASVPSQPPQIRV